MFFQLQNEKFKEAILSFGFTEEQETILRKFYEMKHSDFLRILHAFEIKRLQYHNLEWRFEVQVNFKL